MGQASLRVFTKAGPCGGTVGGLGGAQTACRASSLLFTCDRRPRRREEAEGRDEEESRAGKELQQLAALTGNQFTGPSAKGKRGRMTDVIFMTTS